MESPLSYLVEFSPDAEEHLRALTVRQQRLVLDNIEERLGHEATLPTRNRRIMRPNSLALWELRIGNLRVYCDVEEQPRPTVLIRAVGIKDRNRVRIGGQVIQL